MTRENGYTVHFIGIGGIGMSALARHLLQKGVRVTGSDREANLQTESLAKSGARIFIGHDKANVKGSSLVVYTAAVKNDNCELSEAARLNIPVIPRDKMLGYVFDGFPERIAVCGVHGKTTVTSMLSYVFKKTNISHTSFIGGVSTQEGSNYVGGGSLVIAEACEYKESFLSLHPTVTVALNVELDHPDYYKSYEETQKAFGKFFDNLTDGGTLIVARNFVSEHLYSGRNNVLTYGLDKQCDLYADNLVSSNGRYSFEVYFRNQNVGKTSLSVAGKHNVYNALAVAAACYAENISFEDSLAALMSFVGTERRFTEVPCTFCRAVCDYAHHPTEIEATVAAAKEYQSGRIFALFQPHTYSRTKAFFDRFVACFSGCEWVGYLPVFAAREVETDGANSYSLYLNAKEKGLNAFYFQDFISAIETLKKAMKSDDLLLILGAGDIVNICNLL